MSLKGNATANMRIVGRIGGAGNLNGMVSNWAKPNNDNAPIYYCELKDHYIVEVDDMPELIAGHVYTVNYNGADYVCMCRKGYGGTYLGNAMQVITEYTEPFQILYSEDGSAILGLDELTGVQVSISEGYPYYYNYIEKNLGENVASGNLEFDSYCMDNPIDLARLIPGEVYQVKWGETYYECELICETGNDGADYTVYKLGNFNLSSDGAIGGTGEPFLFYKWVTGSSVLADRVYKHCNAPEVIPYAVYVKHEEGFTATFRSLLKTLFGAAVYTSDQSKNIELLGNILGSNSSGERYTITNNLTFVTTDNDEHFVVSGNAYIATLTPTEEYSMSSITVTMAGVDITETAHIGNGQIIIAQVTGNVVISASAYAPKLDIIIEKLIMGSIAYVDSDNTIKYTGSSKNTTRATAVPLGQYLTKGKKYTFSLNNLATYSYGIQVMKAVSNGLTWSVDGKEGTDVTGMTGFSGRLLDTGWLNKEYTYEATEDNLVVFINFGKDGAANFTDYQLILDNFTIKEV